MTIDEYNFCIEQRKLGRTYEWIAKRLGYSIVTVHTAIKNGYHLDRVNGRCSVYPGLEAWRMQNGYTVARMCVEAGVPYSTIRKLNGARNPEGLCLRDIRDILRFTGRTFEEIFGQEGEHHDVDAAQSRQHRRDDL